MHDMVPMYLQQHEQTIEISKTCGPYNSIGRHNDTLPTNVQKLGWLPFPKRVKYHACVMVFKALNGQATEYLSDLLIKSEQIKNLRSKEILEVPFSKTAYYDRSFSVNGAKLWNSLPLYLNRHT